MSHRLRRRIRIALKNRRGFALPFAIFIMSVMTVAATAGLAATLAETEANMAQRSATRAMSYAEAGLEQFLTNRSNLCAQATSHCLSDPANGTTVDSEYGITVGFTGGYAQIKGIRVRPRPTAADTTAIIFLIRSRGVDTTIKLGGAGMGQYAEHTVGMYATWQTVTMQVLSAWTSLGGFNKNGTAGTIDGNDECGLMPSVAGVTSDSGAVTQSGNWSPTGTPPWDSSMTLPKLESKMQLDWQSIMAGAIPANFTVPPDTFPPATYFSDTSKWPTIRVHTNNFSLPNAGQGMIIADSDFTISGSNMWNGIILIGGQLTSNGKNTMHGATVSGLNLLLPGTPQPKPGVLTDQSDANGQKVYLYNSCSVSRAATAMRSYRAIPNAWMDNLPSW